MKTKALWKYHIIVEIQSQVFEIQECCQCNQPKGEQGQNHPVWFSKTFLADVESRFGKLAGELIVLTEWARLSTVLLTLAHACPVPVQAQTEGGRNQPRNVFGNWDDCWTLAKIVSVHPSSCFFFCSEEPHFHPKMTSLHVGSQWWTSRIFVFVEITWLIKISLVVVWLMKITLVWTGWFICGPDQNII